MIAKRVPRRRDGKSSFGALVKYLENDQGKDSRVGDVTVTNCQSEDSTWAVMEIEATQDLNRRAKTDKTYHLVFSFREGEDISPETLLKIESELCKGLGYEDHQRISVVHRDTDNLHVHVAINKIHPQTYNIIEPYYDHKRLGELCSRIEVEHGLERDNHTVSKGAGKSDDLAAKSGMETLAEWLKVHALPGSESATSWKALHEHFAQFDVVIHKRGAGLVITSGEGISVKASTVGRALSLKALEAKLGIYEPLSGKATTKVKSTYTPKPKIQSDGLFARYQAEQTLNTLTQRNRLDALSKEKEAALAAANRAANTKRAAAKVLRGLGAGALSRKLVYSQIARSRKSAIEKINQDFKERRKRLYEKSPRKSFRDWLAAKAVAGDSEALNYMRATGSRMKGNRLGGLNGSAVAQSPVLPVNDITRSGAVSYVTPGGPIRDDGNRFQLERDPSDTAIATALQLAMRRHGGHLSVDGSPSFKSKVAEVAGRLKLPVSFVEEPLETIRNANKNSAHIDNSAADKYISERNNKRSSGFDIMNHRRFEQKDEGVFAFAGLRNIGGQAVALFKSGEEILALAINESTASKLKHQRLGKAIEVRADGNCQVKGNTRSR